MCLSSILTILPDPVATSLVCDKHSLMYASAYSGSDFINSIDFAIIDTHYSYS